MLNKNNGNENENVNKIQKQKKYYLTRDKNILWTFVIIITTLFIIISYINIKGLSTIHSYTVNVIFGFYSPLFYCLIIFIAIYKLFNLEKTFKFSVFHFSLGRMTSWYLALIALTSMIFYTIEFVGISFDGSDALKVSFKRWFELFKGRSEIKDPALPNLYTPGFLGTFIFALFSLFGQKAGIAIGFTTSIIFIGASIPFFFISDKVLLKISFSRKKREKIRKALIESKSKNIHYDPNQENDLEKNKKINNEEFIVSIEKQQIDSIDNNLDDRSNKDQNLYENNLNNYSNIDNNQELQKNDFKELNDNDEVDIHQIEIADNESNFIKSDDEYSSENKTKILETHNDFEIDDNILDDVDLTFNDKRINTVVNDELKTEKKESNLPKKPRLSIVEDEDDDFFKN
ncbi:hypothetical protein DA803_03250 [[Mycoplasma] phocae]|uniref:Uncharacterized protein n=1 Tax=[Mycoplasma] phocae TaxID=142651 RepID=A0A2Z5IRR0_9BACT|nr:hypothetical protein [[Mycoplasma] phocae]AXE61086.1 hypothetical protein DA803_03250 [[Mycoplasma] phocae]